MSSELENYMIPRLLDAPPMALSIEADTAIIGASGIYLGMLASNPLQFVFSVLFTLTLARYYARIKGSGGYGLLPQMAYWYLPANEKNNPISPNIREYRG